uniref:CSON001190 protein n=1 Tax=Culicoides sonorensis TaxID=179676 RepID=A0A336MTR3_CULSO
MEKKILIILFLLGVYESQLNFVLGLDALGGLLGADAKSDISVDAGGSVDGGESGAGLLRSVLGGGDEGEGLLGGVVGGDGVLASVVGGGDEGEGLLGGVVGGDGALGSVVGGVDEDGGSTGLLGDGGLAGVVDTLADGLPITNLEGDANDEGGDKSILDILPAVGEIVDPLDVLENKESEGEGGLSVAGVSSVLGVDGFLGGKNETLNGSMDLINIAAVLDDQITNIDPKSEKCETIDGELVCTKSGGLLNLDVGLNKDRVFKVKLPVPDKFEIIRKYKYKEYETKNVFGDGEPKFVDPNATCKAYAKCKKFRKFSSYLPLKSPFLFGTPYYLDTQGNTITKKVITQNYYAPGQTSPVYKVESDNEYLRVFAEDLSKSCIKLDSDGSCTKEGLVDKTAIYTLDDIPCDTLYAALRLFDIEQEKQNTLAYADLLIKLDDVSGMHWFKLPPGSNEVAKQILDTEKLQKLYELLLVNYADVDENAFFVLKQNYTSLCTPERVTCKEFECKNNKFYTYDGTCNNPDNKLLGKNPTSLLRIGRPYCTLTKSNNCKLPGARTISLTLGYITNYIDYPKQPHYNLNFECSEYPSFVSLFGLFFVQFAVHDIVKLATRGVHSKQQGGVRGCTRDGRFLPSHLRHDYSVPISLPENDPYYSKFNRTCMEFVTGQKYNAECAVTNVNLGNFVTSYMDLSQLYPSRESDLKDVIAEGGKIKLSLGNYPYISDHRAFQTPLFIVVAELFGLLHNKIAENIKLSQSSLSDYEIFELARTINIYTYQYYYDNFVLPAILGKEYCDHQEITSTKSCYNTKINPTPITEFSCAAARYLHRYLPNKFNLLHPDYTVKTIQELSNNFGGPQIAFDEAEAVFLGMTHQSIYVPGISFQVQNWLFKGDHLYGDDLISLDVQRSRDCCVQPYVFYIKKFFGVEIKFWEDLSHYIPADAILHLKRTYSDVCQIELYTGIAVEKKYEDGLYGPVGRKIMTEQHLHTRCGDSKYYTNALDEVAKSCFKMINYNELFSSLIGVKTTTSNILFSMTSKHESYQIPENSNSMEGVNCLINALSKS